MITFAHIVNPVKVDQASDLYTAQPITFETMSTAREFCLPGIKVTQLTAQYPEDREVIPSGFEPTPDLEGSILDIGSFSVPRKLPLLKDILDRLYQYSSADYLIYTNVDISLQPFFYRTISEIINQGHDAFIINRRTISKKYKRIDEIPLMYSEVGEQHPGWDCFIFRRSLYPGFNLGTACIGINWIGRVMVVNMACLAKKFRIFKDQHLTFHIGNDQSWKTPDFDDYCMHNRSECRKILTAFEKRFGPFDRAEIPGRFFRKLEES